jgi:Ca2+-binding EF-hand superfamily protein
MTVVHDAYTAKMTARFATFDRDHDGHVSLADFEAMAREVLVATGQLEDSPEGHRLLEGARTFFAGLAEVADIDSDGLISEAEFVAAARTRLLRNADGFATIVRPWAEAVVAVADVDGDGIVDLDDWHQVLMAMGATPYAAAEQAAKVGVDGDRAVTVAELLATAVSFYVRGDASHEFDQV